MLACFVYKMFMYLYNVLLCSKIRLFSFFFVRSFRRPTLTFVVFFFLCVFCHRYVYCDTKPIHSNCILWVNVYVHDRVWLSLVQLKNGCLMFSRILNTFGDKKERRRVPLCDCLHCNPLLLYMYKYKYIYIYTFVSRYRSYSQSIYGFTQPFDHESSLKLSASSNYVIIWLCIYWTLHKQKSWNK